MKREELVQKVVAILGDSFKSIQDRELRNYMLAEKIVKKVIEPAVRENEKQLLYLYNSRNSVFDS